MPDGTEAPAQEATTTTTTDADARGGIDAFPEEAQDYIRRLRQENAARRNELKDTTAQLKQFQDANKSDQEKLGERAATAEGRLSEAERKLARYEVAAENGIPLSLAGRLQGSTPDELKADAEKLKQDFGLAEREAAPGGFDGGPRRPVKSAPGSMNEFIARVTRGI